MESSKDQSEGRSASQLIHYPLERSLLFTIVEQNTFSELMIVSYILSLNILKQVLQMITWNLSNRI